MQIIKSMQNRIYELRGERVMLDRAFVEIRKLTLQQIDFAQQLQIIKDKLTTHNIQLNEIYDAPAYSSGQAWKIFWMKKLHKKSGTNDQELVLKNKIN